MPYSELTPTDMIGTAMDTLTRAKAYERNGFPQEACDMLREVRSLCSSAILRMGEERDRQRAEMRRGRRGGRPGPAARASS